MKINTHVAALFLLLCGLLVPCGMMMAMEEVEEKKLSKHEIWKQIDDISLKKDFTYDDKTKEIADQLASDITISEYNEYFCEEIIYFISMFATKQEQYIISKKLVLFNILKQLYNICTEDLMILRSDYAKEDHNHSNIAYLLHHYDDFIKSLKPIVGDEAHNFVVQCCEDIQKKAPTKALRYEKNEQYTIKGLITEVFKIKELYFIFEEKKEDEKNNDNDLEKIDFRENKEDEIEIEGEVKYGDVLNQLNKNIDLINNNKDYEIDPQTIAENVLKVNELVHQGDLIVQIVGEICRERKNSQDKNVLLTYLFSVLQEIILKKPDFAAIKRGKNKKVVVTQTKYQLWPEEKIIDQPIAEYSDTAVLHHLLYAFNSFVKNLQPVVGLEANKFVIQSLQNFYKNDPDAVVNKKDVESKSEKEIETKTFIADLKLTAHLPAPGLREVSKGTSIIAPLATLCLPLVVSIMTNWSAKKLLHIPAYITTALLCNWCCKETYFLDDNGKIAVSNNTPLKNLRAYLTMTAVTELGKVALPQMMHYVHAKMKRR